MVEESSIAENHFVLVGTVTRPHGIKGELKVRPFSDQPDEFCRYSTLYLSATEQGEKKPYAVKQARVSGSQVIVLLEECQDRTLAEQLAGSQTWIPSDALPPLEADEFYLHTLIGKAIRTVAGQELGRATNVLSTSGQDLLVIRQAKKEYLIPIVKPFICSIDEQAVVLDLPEGLLEING